MSTELQSVLHSALLRLLRPLTRVMLRHGMAYGTFAEIARKAFVDEAFEMLARSGQRQSISSVAAMTGLTRKEAARLAKLEGSDSDQADQRYNRAVRVITGWSLDPRFATAGGHPRGLELEGEDSFATLVKDYSGDVTPKAMLTTLETSGTVSVADGVVRLEQRAYLPTHTPVASLTILGNDVAELITSIDHNLSADAGDRVFQRKVSTAVLKAEALDAFRELSNAKSQELLETYDAWLTEHETGAPAAPDTGSDSDSDTCYVAVGIYYFDETLHKDPRDENDL
jgi:hypothetical protein